MSDVMDPRIVISTIKDDGRVQFGQAVMEQQEAPQRVILVALDPDFGLVYWECSHNKLSPHTLSQHPGYSRCLPAFDIDDEPVFLGDAYEIPREDIANWSEIVRARTRAKNRLIYELFA